MGVVVIFGGIRAIDGKLSLGEFVQFYSYLLALVFPLRMIGSLVGNAQRASASGQRIFEVLDTEPDLFERPDRSNSRRAWGHVEFVGVSFAHSDTGPDVLANLDLDIPAGRVLALIGPNRSGKTTLDAADPPTTIPRQGRCCWTASTCATSGSISCDAAVGVVAQDPFLFSTRSATTSPTGSSTPRRRCAGAARLAQAEGFSRRAARRLRHDHRRARATPCRGDSASASRSREPSSPTRAC